MIQFGLPSSLSTFLQRAGRAGRSESIQAEAIIFVEESAFQRQQGSRDVQVGEQDDGDESRSQPVYRKKVDPALRLWIEAKDCRRRVADEYFNNPPRPYSEYLDHCIQP